MQSQDENALQHVMRYLHIWCHSEATLLSIGYFHAAFNVSTCTPYSDVRICRYVSETITAELSRLLEHTPVQRYRILELVDKEG